MSRADARSAVDAAGVLATLAAAAPWPAAAPAPALGAALAVATLWAPGHALARLLRPAAPAGERALLALALSPWLVAAPAAALAAAGAGTAAAARAALALAAALCAAAALRARGVPAPGGPGARAVAAIACAWAALVAAMFAVNPHLAPRSDGWFHAAVVEQIAARGLPVEDPAFAGLPLLYFWGHDLWAALWVALAPALAVWTPLAAFNVAAAAAVVLAVDALAVRLGARGGTRSLAAGLALLGPAPFAWLAPAARALTGETRGAAEFAAFFEAGASSALRALSEGMLHPSLAFFGDKFLVPTPFALGLALFPAILAAWHDAAVAPRASAAATLAALAGAALFVHTVVGLTVLLLAAAWGLPALAGGPALRRAALVTGAALAVALAAHTPYLLAVAGGKQGQLGPGFGAAAAWSFAWGGAAVVPAGFAWLVARARHAPPARHALWVAVVLASLALGLRLPENNQSKFLNLLLLALAPAAALGWASAAARLAPAARRALAACAAAALVPGAALALWGFAAEHGREEEPWHRAAPGARAAWSWARARTAPDAIVADAGGGSDMTVLAARSALWGGGHVERDWGHAATALEARRRAARELGSGAPLSKQTRALLRGLGREVLVVERASDTTAASPPARLARRPGYRPVFVRRGIALYRWEGGS